MSVMLKCCLHTPPEVSSPQDSKQSKPFSKLPEFGALTLPDPNPNGPSSRGLDPLKHSKLKPLCIASGSDSLGRNLKFASGWTTHDNSL